MELSSVPPPLSEFSGSATESFHDHDRTRHLDFSGSGKWVPFNYSYGTALHIKYDFLHLKVLPAHTVYTLRYCLNILMDFSFKDKETSTDLTTTKMNIHVCLSQLIASPCCKDSIFILSFYACCTGHCWRPSYPCRFINLQQSILADTKDAVNALV